MESCLYGDWALHPQVRTAQLCLSMRKVAIGPFAAPRNGPFPAYCCLPHRVPLLNSLHRQHVFNLCPVSLQVQSGAMG